MDGPPRKLPPKREVLLALLSEGGVFVHLDPRRQGVLVPKWYQNQPELILQLGLNMSIPIPDLEVDDDGVSCTLSFNRAPFWCKLPWAGIFALVSEKDRRGIVWPEDVPPESALSRGSAPPPSAKPARPKLTALGPNDRLEPEPESGDGLLGMNADGDAERAPAPDGAKCAGCATRWPEDQSTCPVCGSNDWVAAAGDGAADQDTSTSETAAGPKMTLAPATGSDAPVPEPRPAIPPGVRAAPARGGRPTLVEGGGNDKKRTSPRVKAKPRASKKGAGSSADSPRTLGLVPPEAAPTSSEARPDSASPRPDLRSMPSARVPEPIREVPPPPLSRERPPAQPLPERRPAAAGEREPIEADDDKPSDDDSGGDSPGKKPSKRPLPPYLRVVK